MAKEAETKTYKLKPGQKHLRRIKSEDSIDTHEPMQAGDEIELTKGQAHAFRDKFEEVHDEDEDDAPVAPAPKPAQGSKPAAPGVPVKK